MATKHNRLTVYLCVAAIFSVLLILSLFIPIYGEICTQSEYTIATECVSHHIAVIWFWQIARWLDATSVFLTAAATVGLVIVTYLLVKLGREQSKTTRAQLRAYVMVGAATTYEIAPNRMPRAKIQIKNFGQTPAYNLRAGIGMGFAKWPFEDVDWPTFDFDKPEISERPIAPSDHFPLLIDLSRALSSEQVAAMYGGRWALWICGKVVYRDAFDEVHQTEFCFFTTKVTEVGTLAAVEGRNSST